MTSIRLCRADERDTILEIINAAAEAYRGVIPADRWHEPYMSRRELDGEIAAGVVFWGSAAPDTEGAALVGVMGIQPVQDVDLIRHAYVRPGGQRHGVGGALIEHLRRQTTRRMLVGTWEAAEWAVRFYGRTASIGSRPSARPRCSSAIGPFQSVRSRPRSCWPIRRSRTETRSISTMPSM
ncbi:MAG: GNAT family N-acetyltransferase [Pseudomonadota bacterium]